MHTEERDGTIGELRVRVDFNPYGSQYVDEIKEQTAKLIDLCERMESKPGLGSNTEQTRLCALAQTAYEEACMWAVKAATS